MQDFRKLKVWQKAHQLALDVFRATEDFPRQQLYTLTSQTQRAVLSVPTNIAEGCGRGSDADFARFATIAMGSASETEYLLLFARDLGFLPKEKHETLEPRVQEIKRMLSALITKLQKS